MGGAAFVFTGDHDFEIMHNSALININICEVATKRNVKKNILFFITACIYPEYNQLDPQNPVIIKKLKNY